MCIVRVREKKSYRGPDDMGIALVEIALTIPFFIIAIFSFIWVAQYWNAKSSLNYAVGNALKLAQTRGNPMLKSNNDPTSGLIPQVDEFQGGQSDALDLLLASPEFRSGDYIGYYNSKTMENLCGGGDGTSSCNLENAPTEYIYALIYINESMRQNIGAGLRYPCDPTLDDITEGGPGCLSCQFDSPGDYLSDDNIGGAGGMPRIISLTCTYQPNLSVLSSIVGMLNVISGDLAIPKILLTTTKSIEST